MDTLLEVRGLKTHFTTDRGLFRAVDGISFSVPPRHARSASSANPAAARA